MPGGPTVCATLGLFAVLIASAGLLALLQLAGLGRWLVLAQTQAELLVLQATGNELAGMCARFAVAAMSMVLLPTVLLGAAFPLAVRLAVDGRRVGRDVGTVVALNTLGGILGVGLTGFVLIPAVGLVRTLALLAGLAALVGLIAAWRGNAVGRPAKAMVLMWPGLRGGGRAAGATPGRAAAWCTQRPADFLPGRQGRHCRGGQSDPPGQGFSRLYIQGVSNTGDAMPSLRYMRLQALLPLLIHAGEPRSALVIGFGTGSPPARCCATRAWNARWWPNCCPRYWRRAAVQGQLRRRAGPTPGHPPARWPPRVAAQR
jgi:hypothetical protein